MRIRQLALLGLFTLILTTAGSAQTMYDSDVKVNISETDLEVGDTITMTVSLENFDEDNFSYQFLFGGAPVNTSETSLEHEINGMGFVGVRVINGSEIIAEDHPDSYSIGNPQDMVQIEVPESVKPGERFNATARITHDVYEDYEFQWESSEVISDSHDVQINQSGRTITLRARDDGEAPDDAHLTVDVTYGEDEHLDQAEAMMNWDLYNPDVDGLDTTYEEGLVELDIGEDRLGDQPEIRTGAALEGVSRIEITGRLDGGGASLTFEQVDTGELDPPEDIVVYSAVNISGKNLQGLMILPQAVVSKGWLEENGLLISDNQANVGYYRVTDGEWELLPSETGYSDLDDHIELDVAFGEAVEDDAYMLEGGTRIVIAGNAEGIDFGRFGVGPEGQCERLEEDAPLPYGWNEINVPCEVHEDAQNLRERIDRWEGEEGFEIPDGFEENISEVESMLDNYEIQEAEETLEQLRDAMREAQEVQEEMERLEQEFEQRYESQERTPPEMQAMIDEFQQQLDEGNIKAAEQTLDQLQDTQRELERLEQEFEQRFESEHRIQAGIRDQYNRSEKMQAMIDEFQQHLDEGNITAAEQTLEQLREQREKEIERLQRTASIRNQIEELRQRDLNQQQQEQLEEAEQFLEDGNLTAAEQQIGPIRESFQQSGLRGVIESVIEVVLSDILGVAQADSAQQSLQSAERMDEPGEGPRPPEAPE